MGRPKATLVVAGRSLLGAAWQAAVATGAEVLLLGSGPVPDDLPVLPRLEDGASGVGPTAGILAALAWRPDALWLILPCDLPHVGSEATRWLVGQGCDDAVATFPRVSGGRPEPLLALYTGAAAAPLAALSRRGRGPSGLPSIAPVATPDVPSSLRAAWRGANSPEELERMLDLSAEAGPGRS